MHWGGEKPTTKQIKVVFSVSLIFTFFFPSAEHRRIGKTILYDCAGYEHTPNPHRSRLAMENFTYFSLRKELFRIPVFNTVMVWLEILHLVNNLASELTLALFLKLVSDTCCVWHGVSHCTFEIIRDFCYASNFVVFSFFFLTSDYPWLFKNCSLRKC